MKRSPPLSSLGSVTYRRVDGIAPLVCAAFLLLAALVIRSEITTPGNSSRVFPFGLLAIAAALVCYRIFLRPLRVLRIHENGVSTLGVFGVSAFATADITGFGYDGRSETFYRDNDKVFHVHFVNMTYEILNGRRIRYAALFDYEGRFVSDAHRELVERDYRELVERHAFPIVRSIAERLKNDLETQGFATWTETLRITKLGIQYHCQRSTDAKWIDVPLKFFDCGHEYLFRDGKWCLLEPESVNQMAVHIVDSAASNFFAGLLLLNWRHPHRQSDPLPEVWSSKRFSCVDRFIMEWVGWFHM